MNEIKRIYFGKPPEGVEPPPYGNSYFVEDGWKIEVVDAATVRLTKEGSSYYVKNVPFEVVRAKSYRKLQDTDFQRINLPPDFWAPKLDRVPKEALAPIRNYLLNEAEMIADGLGFVLLGETGVGKTSIAAMLSIQAYRLNRSVFFITVSDLREMVRHRIAFDQTTSILERCREVDFLVLDNLRPEDAKEVPLDATALEGVLESRTHWKRPTVITSRMRLEEFGVVYPNIMEVLRARSPVFTITGENQREADQKANRQKMLLDSSDSPVPKEPVQERITEPGRFGLPGRRKK